MFAGIHRVDGDLRVPVIRRGDEDGIDIVPFQELPIICIALAFAHFLRPGKATPVNIGYGEDFNVIGVASLHQAVEMVRAHTAATDNAKADAIVGAEDRGVGRAGKAYGAASSEGGGFDEGATRSGW